ncbi:hypothetical protein NUITMVRE18_20890 [Enterococcus faecium]|nr:hypothetical protein EfmKUHS13_24080 [Enterococcus faecium]BDP47763.1 hypothetical protein EfmJHP9_26330 [Enterococcus faecium]BDP51275.1 hypothetical protein EfmJHP10_27110 [Enterococcus faecium]BDP58545.1 hypothetical protein EfmJHP36_30240 [Enterococcus faecium]BDP62018.1 hypothetical protein EfmJHP38_29560 [Enterococcus faecium]
MKNSLITGLMIPAITINPETNQNVSALFFLYHIHKAAQANKMMTVRGLPNLVIKSW